MRFLESKKPTGVEGVEWAPPDVQILVTPYPMELISDASRREELNAVLEGIRNPPSDPDDHRKGLDS